MSVEPFTRLDNAPEIRKRLLPYCRLKSGDIWIDSVAGHKVGLLDAADSNSVEKIFNGEKATLAVQDPPYNVVVGAENTDCLSKRNLADYVNWSKHWIENNIAVLAENASLYIWLGADQREGFQPLPDFMIMMRNYSDLQSRSFITMRNQRGYGTQKNWMAVRQECLYYTKGNPVFHVDAEYTDIPKILRQGYYKQVNGERTDNMQRSKSGNIRAGNVWVDVQQVFYRLHENVTGCYAQKPLKCIERIIKASSSENDLVADFFAHSGTTLIAGEKLNRRVFTFDNDPIFAELTIRRLEHFRKTGLTGFQCGNPFPEIDDVVLTVKKDESKTSNRRSKLSNVSKTAEPVLF
ncbi:MAG: site-specific DNA-methyltransferase [Planctomycetaceae bacterium]|jgi:site-specific DNA-methyltransferase (adenine-specific)|nr:site-specific DNA-methyltransferase [Planctomycetaceae bacterium]